MDKDTVLAIVAIIAGLIGALNYFTSARRGIVDELKQQVDLLKQEIKEEKEKHTEEIAERDVERKKLKNRVVFLGKLALDRESQINKMSARVNILNGQVDKIARELYQSTLEVFALRKALADATGDQSIMGATAPLPPLPDDAK